MKQNIGQVSYPKAVKFCATNVLTLQLHSTLLELHGKGIPIQIESCLNMCGICRHSYVCIVDDERLAFDTEQELLNRALV